MKKHAGTGNQEVQSEPLDGTNLNGYDFPSRFSNVKSPLYFSICPFIQSYRNNSIPSSVKGNPRADQSSLHYQQLRSLTTINSYLLLVYRDPVCAGEPLVPLDVVDAVLEVAVALGQVNLEQVAEEVLQVGAEVRREPDLEQTKEDEHLWNLVVSIDILNI